MRSPCRARALAVSALVVAALCCGCATTTQYPIEEERRWLPSLLGPASVRQLPLTVGLHIPRSLRERALTSKHGRETVNFSAGATHVPYLEWAVQQLFARVEHLASFSADAQIPAHLAGVLELADVGPGWMRVALHAREQAPAAWDFVGSGDTGRAERGQAGATRALTFRLRDATAQFLVRFTQKPQVEEWLKRAGTAPPAPVIAEPEPPRQTGMAVAIDVGRGSGANCVQQRLRDDARALRFMPFDDLQLALYPWLETSTAPSSDGESAFWGRPDIRQRTRALGIRYLLRLSGDTSHVEPGGFGGCGLYGCMGVKTGTRRSQVWAALWDLHDGRKILDDTVEKSSGYAIVWLALPIPIIPATESPACETLARRILEHLDDAPRRVTEMQF